MAAAPILPMNRRGFGLLGSNRSVTSTTWPTEAGMAYLVRKRANIARIIFPWEAMQKPVGGTPACRPLDPTNLAGLKRTVSFLTAQGMTVILDCHNFSRYSTTGADAPDSAKAVVGDPGSVITNALFADFWARLATEFGDNPLVSFELMNEPYTLAGGAVQMAATYQAAITAIRATGGLNPILINGYAYSAAGDWMLNGNSEALLKLTDPADNLVFCPHVYLDGQGGKTTATIAGEGPYRAATVIQWAITNGKKLLFTEIGGAKDAAGLAGLKETIDFLESYSDVVLGWCAFGLYAGQPSYLTPDSLFLAMDPDTYDVAYAIDDPRFAVFDPYLKGALPAPTRTAIASTAITGWGGGLADLTSAKRLVEDKTAGEHAVYVPALTTVVGKKHILTFDVRRDAGNRDVVLKLSDPTGSVYALAAVSLDNSKVTFIGGNAAPYKLSRPTVTIRRMDNATWRITIATIVNDTKGVASILGNVILAPNGCAALPSAYAGDGASGVTVSNVSWKLQ